MKKNIVALLCAMITLSASPLSFERGRFRIVVPPGSPAPVSLAANTLARDFGKVMRWQPPVDSVCSARESNIVLLSDPAAGSGWEVRPLDGVESHRLYLSDDGRDLYLLGNDMRGAIYAAYTFSEEFLGVPPLWYFCGWVPGYKPRVEVPAGYDKLVGSPSVRFRAWFPNDEDMLNPWREKSWENDELWLEAMLRLKLNTVEFGPTVTYPDHKMSHNADLLKKYGLVLTSHHMVGLNNSFANWEQYWKQVKGVEAPELLLANIEAIKEFWSYNIETIMANNQENLWQIAFRGRRDEPFWNVFADAPADEAARAEVINRMVGMQYDMIKQATGEADPFVRMTFYDELSDLLAKGWLKPPSASNMLWTFVAGRRDHYPYDDLVNYDFSKPMQLGYYMNLQFTSTGAHLAPAEGPWKMEANYRYVLSRGPLTFSVVNAGNIREFLMEMSANAAMMWNVGSYSTDDFLHDFCAQYYGADVAADAAALYRAYYDAYWLQKPSVFPGMDRQFIFQDLRYCQVFNQVLRRFDDFSPNPLTDIGFERVPRRSFRLDGINDVDSIIAGTGQAALRFAAVADSCSALMARIPIERQAFFYDNLASYASYMASLSESLHHFMQAYKGNGDRLSELKASREALAQARSALHLSQHGPFGSWYANDHIWDLSDKLRSLDRLINRVDSTR